VLNVSLAAQSDGSNPLGSNLSTGNTSTMGRQDAVIRSVLYTCQTDSPYGWTCEEEGYASPGDTCWCIGPPPAYGHVIRSS
jgi:hypothetical protein